MDFKEWLVVEIFEHLVGDCVFDAILESEMQSVRDSSFRDSIKKLQNSILILRWNAMRKRDEIIKGLKKIKKENIMSLTPVLEKLGYINIDKLKQDGFDDQKIESVIKLSFKKALKEKDNTLPPDITEDMLTPEKINQATQDFFTSIRNIFENSLRHTKNKTRQGYKIFDTLRDKTKIDDISNSFSLKILEIFTEKNKRKSWNVPAGYEHLGSLGASEMDDERYAEKITAYIGAYLKRFYSNEERRINVVNQPGAGTEELDVWGGNRDKKAALINSDILNNNLSFYQKYLLANDSELEKLEEKISKIENLNRMTDSIRKEKWRLEIVKQILHLRHKHKELSVEPSKIINTLKFFRSNFLYKKHRVPSFISDMNSEQEPVATQASPEQIAATKETKNILHSKLADALNALRNYGNLDSDGYRIGAKHALTICLFWDLGNCDKPSAFSNISAFSNLITSLNKQGLPTGGVAQSCEDHLFQLRADNRTQSGKNIEQLVQDVNKVLGKQVPPNTVRNWLANGIKFVCRHLKS